MEDSADSQKELIARESLETFAAISDAARRHLDAASSASIQIADNSWTNPDADRNRRRIDGENAEGHRRLMAEPAIARVAVTDEDGAPTTYYICRTAPVSTADKSIKLASYRSEVGRLAALPLGSDHTIYRAGEPISVEVTAYARFEPKAVNGEWDARNAVMAGAGFGPVTVESLRRLLELVAPGIDVSLLDALLAEENDAHVIREGLRRNVISKMDLRDQPILDQYQDDIFRLPLNSRLLLLGAPGTGKTTTLIRRLGQKLDTVFLTEMEQRVLASGGGVSNISYQQDWVMFTPTELLKLYVKEAFAREDIAASDDRISTWADYRDNLARNEFAILRSASNNGLYVLKETIPTLKPEAYADAIDWFEDFDRWQKAAFWDEMRTSANALSEHDSAEIARLGGRLLATIGDRDQETAQIFVAMLPLADEIGRLIDERKKFTDAELHKALNLQVNRDRRFLESLGAFVEGLTDLADDMEEQEEEEEEANQPRVGRAAAANHYMRVLRSHARLRARRRNLSKTSRSGRILDWLGDRIPPDAELQRIGESLILQGSLRWFVSPVRRYIDAVPQRYRRFRRSHQAEGIWYHAAGFVVTDIHPLEVDIVLLAMLRESDELIRYDRRLDPYDSQAQHILARMNRLYRTQVLVDEVTDFSCVQLRCMATLARPGIRSFFACGDFNQRVTPWGTRSIEQIQWAIPDIEKRSVSIAYRQSSRLHDFARRLVAMAGEPLANVALSNVADNEGVAPTLALGMDTLPKAATWLGQRIIEIEQFVQELPSIAVLVNSEADVRPVAEALGNLLVDSNIKVIPCPDGQVRGREGAVRVFNIEHIKGLEFEAVFFVGIDALAKELPELFDKYLYVGATRAATYLGLTCVDMLPERMADMSPLFTDRW